MIFQFVPFRDFIDPARGMESTQARLAKEVLAEVPTQFLSYMKACKVTPGSWRTPGHRLNQVGTQTPVLCCGDWDNVYSKQKLYQLFD